MMIKIFITACLILLAQKSMQPQEPDPASFFPSSVDNLWQYDTPLSSYQVTIIKDSADQNGNRFLFYTSLSRPRIKLDTTYNVFRLHTSIDTILYHYYKLNADYKETWMVQPEKLTSLGAQERIEARVDSVYQALRAFCSWR